MSGRTRRRAAVAAALWLVLAPAASAPAVTVTEVPTPRPGGWVTDLTGTLPPAAVEELNRLGDRVRAETGAELAVVVVPSVDGGDPRDFAVRLFNHWGIGSAGDDDGVLVFAALGDRAAEIVLGDGVAGVTQQRASDSIMAQVMVPRFRQGRPAEAVVEGARACATRILGLASEPPVPAAAPPGRVEALPGEVPHAAAPAPAREARAPARAAAVPELASDRRRTPPRVLLALSLGAVLWIAGALALIAGVALAVWRSRRCPGCREPLVMLDETADDAYLSDPEKAEERLGSVDHRVWWCPACQRTVKRSRTRWGSGYTGCGRCGVRAARRRETVLQAATEWSQGLVRVDEVCAHCDHGASHTYTTPRLQAHHRSRRSAFSSSGSSSSSSRSSGGSSGFGGGRSSGRGSSGRW